MALIALPHPEDHNPDRRAVIVDPANPSEDASDSNSGTSGQRRGQGQRPAALVDLAALLSDGYEPSFADVGITVDGVALFYRGKVNGLFGAPEMAGIVALPGGLMFSTVFYVSLVFSFSDSFGRTPVEDLPAA